MFFCDAINMFWMCDFIFFNDIIFSLYQDNANCVSVAAVKEQLRQLLCATRPSVLLSCRPAQASEVKVSQGLVPDAQHLLQLSHKKAWPTSVYKSVTAGQVTRGN